MRVPVMTHLSFGHFGTSFVLWGRFVPVRRGFSDLSLDLGYAWRPAALCRLTLPSP